MGTKKGISLIVLILTIIVMIILSGAIIISLNNINIIDEAKEAVKDMDHNQLQYIAQLGWSDAYLEGAREVDGANGLRAGVEKALIANKLDPEDYGMIITKGGVEKIAKGWIKDGFTVVKGTQRLEIGDIVQYDETVGGAVTIAGGDVQWKVLGADENGDLLIVCATAPRGITLGSTSNLEKAQTDWLNVEKILNGYCEQYGNGIGVIGKPRNMKIEDINEITGYDKNTFKNYGLETTFYYGTNTQLKYKNKNTNGGFWSGAKHDNGFYYYEDGKFLHIEDITSGKNFTAFATVTNNFYQYNTSNTVPKIDATNNAKVYKTLFKVGPNYYLANNYINCGGSSISYGIFAVGADVFGTGLWTSVGTPSSREYYIRPVVTLTQNIRFTGSSSAGWTYNIEGANEKNLVYNIGEGGSSSVIGVFNRQTGTLTIRTNGVSKAATGNYSNNSSPFRGIKDKIKTVIIEDGVTKLGKYLFQSCESLTKIQMPSSGIIIAPAALTELDSLTDVIIPDKDVVYYIGDESDSSAVGVFNGKTGTLTIRTNGVAKAATNDYLEEERPFKSIEDKIKTVIVEDGITELGSRILYSCENLTKLQISSSVSTIGHSAFSNSKLKELELPEGVKAIESWAFSSCDALEKVHIPSSVTSMGNNLFRNGNMNCNFTFGENFDITNSGISAEAFYYGTDSWSDFWDYDEIGILKTYGEGTWKMSVNCNGTWVNYTKCNDKITSSSYWHIKVTINGKTRAMHIKDTPAGSMK